MADGLTKALQNNAFKAFVNQIGLVDIKQELEKRELREITAQQLEDEIQQQLEELDGSLEDTSTNLP